MFLNPVSSGLPILLITPIIFLIAACGGYDDEIESLHNDIDFIKGHLSEADTQISQLREDVTRLETQIEDYKDIMQAATVVEVKVETYGETTIRREVDRDRDIWVSRTVLGRWHAEIEITFSKTPVGLDISYPVATHFIHSDPVMSGNDHRYKHRWGQTENIVTLYLSFNAEVLLWGTGAATYEGAKANRPDIDWKNWAAYTIDFTLDWDTGRQFMTIPVRPSDQILEWY